MIEREALRLALKALQSDDYWTHVEAVNAIHKALDTSLAQPAVSETHKRTWVHATEWRGLTDEEIKEIRKAFVQYIKNGQDEYAAFDLAFDDYKAAHGITDKE